LRSPFIGLIPGACSPNAQAYIENSMNQRNTILTLILILFFIGSLVGDTGPNHQRRLNRPIKLGTSGGNNTDITPDFCCSGTLGAVVRDAAGNRYILSNNHVIANTNNGRPGQPIGQPGLIDANCRVARAEPVAQLTRFVTILFGGGQRNKVDAAIARVIPGRVSNVGRILDIGRPGPPIAPRLGMRVKKSGRTTGKTVGRIIAVNATVRVEMPDFCGDERGRIARFVQQIVVETTTNRRFTDSGDSGSLIVTRQSSCPRSVGLLFAADEDGVAIGNRIQNVLSALNVSIVGCASSLAAKSPLETQGTHLDPGIMKIERIRERNEERFLRLQDVVGIGIGQNQNGAAGYTILVFAKKNLAKNPFSTLPTHLEGIPVRVFETSGFKAK
jgi:hypothetical protein